LYIPYLNLIANYTDPTKNVNSCKIKGLATC
jgi:hypothetical protein